jgi:hypothetical protein
VKGISEVLGSTLLLAVGVSVAGVYSTFASDFSQSAGNQVAGETRSDIKCNSASIDVRGLNYDGSSSNVQLSVFNTGTVDLKGVSVFAINDTAEPINSTEISLLDTSESIDVVLKSRTKPAYVTAAIDECPSIQPREEF